MEEKNSFKSDVNAGEILDKIIALTFTRHANLSEEEFMEKIGVSDSRGEDVEVRNARYALISACTREILKTTDKIELLKQVIMLALGVSEKDLEGKNNGK